MKSKRIQQFELPGSGEVFNLAGESGEDPLRVQREATEANRAREERIAFERKMQQTLEQCPGFVGADVPGAVGMVGRVVVDAAQAGMAADWLKRRFAVNEKLELSGDNTLCLEIIPRNRRVTKGTRAPKVSFRKPEQFTFNL